MKRRLGKDRIYLIVTGLILQVVLMFPWLSAGGKHFTTYSYLAELHAEKSSEAYVIAQLGGSVDNFMTDSMESMLAVLKLHMILLIVVQILGLICILMAFGKKKRSFLCVVNLVICAANIFSVPVGPLLFLPGWLSKLYLFIILVLEGVHFIGYRMVDSWAEATEEMRRIRERERLAKKERKERLAFEGKFSALFYQVIWKNFKSCWRMYRIFVLVGGMSISFIFAGLGMREMLAGMHGSDNLARGQGLGAIVLNFLAVAIVISVFLIVSVLMFYLKNHVKNYALFLNLGMRTRTLYLFVGIELVSCMLISLVGGCILGNVILLACRAIINSGFDGTIVLESVTIKTYLLTLLVSFLVYLVSAMATHDIYIDTGASASRYKDVMKEKMPGKLSPVFLVLGALMIVFASVSFAQREKAEWVILIDIFFAGLYMFLRNGWNLYLRGRKKRDPIYFGSLLKNNYFYHHFKTAFRYLFLITLIHISVLFVFSRGAISAMIAEEPEDMFLYDYVCMATDEDEALFEKIENEEDAEVFVYPMVRVTNVDNSVAMDNMMRCIMPQGQHIGISESTYRELCERAGQAPKELNLSEDGSDVYIIFQEDQSVNAHPLDYYLLDRREPYLHIGQPVTSYDFKFREQYFPPRKVVGMEVNNLIGNLNQGEHENIVVFSDTYFEQVKDLWKTTNYLNGETIAEEEGIEEVTTHHWPDRLVLMNVKKENRSAVEKKLKAFEKNHTFDDNFDSVVKSWYSKDQLISKIKTERFMTVAVSFFIIGIMTIVTMLLLYMKAESEMEEKKKQQEFLQCMGMRKKERLRVIRSELQFFFRVPLFISTAVMAVFTGILWKIRMYTQADCMAYTKVLIIIYVVYMSIQLLAIKGLQHYIIKNVEGTHGNDHKNR